MNEGIEISSMDGESNAAINNPPNRRSLQEINLTVSKAHKCLQERGGRTEQSQRITAYTRNDYQSTVRKKSKHTEYACALRTSIVIQNNPSNFRRNWMSKHGSMMRQPTQQ